MSVAVLVLVILTIFFSTERVLLVSFIVRGGGAPELPVCAALGSARVVRLPHEDEGEHARLPIGVTAIHLIPGFYPDTRERKLSPEILTCLVSSFKE